MNIENKLLDIFKSVGIYIEKEDYEKVLVIDSLQFVSIIIMIEEEFLLRISSDFDNFDSLIAYSDFYNLVISYFEQE